MIQKYAIHQFLKKDGETTFETFFPDKNGDYCEIKDIEKIFNNIEFPQCGDNMYIDGFHKAYQLLYEAIFK